jgi:glycosyltransferase involved in cell wall biosynthesis
MSVIRKQILFLSAWYPSLAHPTLGNFVQRHAEAVATFHDVSVLYLAGANDTADRIRVAHHQEKGVHTTVVYYNNRGLLRHFRRLWAFRVGLKTLEKRTSKQFDIIHHNVLWPDGWQALWAARRWGIPFIVTEHWTGYHSNRLSERSPFVVYLSKWVASKAAFVSPVTQHLAQHMQALGIKGQYEVVPNVVDTSLFAVSEKPKEGIHFLHISSLVDEHKNISGILRVWKKLSDMFPHVHLEIGGDGPWEQWQSIASELAIRSTSISFFGTISWVEVAEKMKHKHALVLFSNYENLPCVIVEALASGLAIVSSKVGGISEHITHERGILVEPKNEDELLAALCKFVEQPLRFAPIPLRTYAELHFSQEAIAFAFDTLYTRALQKSREA